MSVSHKGESAPIPALRDPKSGVWTGASTPNPNALFALLCSASELGLWLPAAGVCGKPEYEPVQQFLAQDEEPNRQRDREAQRATAQHVVGTASREQGEILSE